MKLNIAQLYTSTLQALVQLLYINRTIESSRTTNYSQDQYFYEGNY